MLPTTNQTQQYSRNYPFATIQSQGAKPKAGRFLTTGTRRNPRNTAFQLNQTTSRCSLDWFLNSIAGHPVAIFKTWSLTKSNDVAAPTSSNPVDA
ncbi:cysteine-rich receptor-like protein kinase 10 [Dorcoceras hygrometricum]|uniref:Cysteine-rich receptor-like protein kinase 10 n=1 Tax=Dorcoceras hygrometricum TaxID=472368 RepID=A0A2Z6ZUK8_9LAMI|nr:cysteine-rich receptor-like protein kinase 10 [Dorcoceras hygrometricum]